MAMKLMTPEQGKEWGEGKAEEGTKEAHRNPNSLPSRVLFLQVVGAK